MTDFGIVLLYACILFLSSCVFFMKQRWPNFFETHYLSPASNKPPFKFLQLPPELRLMVYERLEDNLLQRVDFIRKKGATISTLSLFATPPPPSAILATCRLIDEEARAIIKPMCQRYMKAGLSAPYIEADAEALNILRGHDGLFHNILKSCKSFAAKGAGNPKLGEYRANRKSLRACITRFGYKPTTSKTAAAKMLDMFTKMSTRAILENGTVYGQSYPRHSLPTSRGRRIDIMFCERNNYVEVEIKCELPRESTVKHLRYRPFDMEEWLHYIQDRWFDGIEESIDLGQIFLRTSGYTSVVIVVGEVPSWSRGLRFPS